MNGIGKNLGLKILRGNARLVRARDSKLNLQFRVFCLRVTITANWMER